MHVGGGGAADGGRRVLVHALVVEVGVGGVGGGGGCAACGEGLGGEFGDGVFAYEFAGLVLGRVRRVGWRREKRGEGREGTYAALQHGFAAGGGGVEFAVLSGFGGIVDVVETHDGWSGRRGVVRL